MTEVTVAEPNTDSRVKKLEELEYNRLRLVETLDKMAACTDEDYGDVVLHVLVAWVRLSRGVGLNKLSFAGPTTHI
jgi:hypothetical protein